MCSPLDEITLKTNVSMENEDPEAIGVIQPLYEAWTQKQWGRDVDRGSETIKLYGPLFLLPFWDYRQKVRSTIDCRTE